MMQIFQNISVQFRAMIYQQQYLVIVVSYSCFLLF
nr:MAG TPA: hypothetical protein [Caudoviricetes sp.]